MSNCSVSRRNRQQRPGDSAYAQILRTLLFLSIPTIVEEVLATLLQYVDTAMVGQLGEQATASVSITTNVTWLVNSAAGAVGTAILVLFFGAHLLMSLFTPSRPVVDLGAEMLRLVALSEPFFGLMVVQEGVFYGLGRTRYSFIVETVGMWCVRILFTFLCVRYWGLGLRAVWYCMIADNVVKALLFAVPALRFLFPGKPRSEKA